MHDIEGPHYSTLNNPVVIGFRRVIALSQQTTSSNLKRVPQNAAANGRRPEAPPPNNTQFDMTFSQQKHPEQRVAWRYSRSASSPTGKITKACVAQNIVFCLFDLYFGIIQRWRLRICCKSLRQIRCAPKPAEF